MGMTIATRFAPPSAVMPPPDAGAGKAGAKSEGLGDSVYVTKSPFAGAVEDDPAVLDDLRRDGPLGELFSQAFTLPPPSMPAEIKA